MAGLGQTVAAGGMVLIGEHRGNAVRFAGLDDAGMIGSHHHAASALLYALGHAHDHGRAADIGQRLFRQARAGQPGRNQDGVAGAHALGAAALGWRPASTSSSLRVRASFSSSTGMPSRMG